MRQGRALDCRVETPGQAVSALVGATLVADVDSEPCNLDMALHDQRTQRVYVLPGAVPNKGAVVVQPDDGLTALLRIRIPQPLFDPPGYVSLISGWTAVEVLNETPIILAKTPYPEVDDGSVVERQRRLWQRSSAPYSLLDESELIAAVLARTKPQSLLRDITSRMFRAGINHDPPSIATCVPRPIENSQTTHSESFRSAAASSFAVSVECSSTTRLPVFSRTVSQKLTTVDIKSASLGCSRSDQNESAKSATGGNVA